MDLLLILTYAAMCIAIFKIFKIPLNKWSVPTAVLGGIVLIGGDWAASTECYYNVYQKHDEQLVAKEFAFSLDCICPFGIVTWYTNHNDDRQKVELIKYIGAIRKDKSFMDAFYAFHDSQRAKYKICPRDSHGYYGVVDPSIGPQELWAIASTMLNELNEAGLNQKAVDVLINSGFNASVNEVGHVAIMV